MTRVWVWMAHQALLPAAWRGPVFALLFWRPWRRVAIGTTLAVVGLVAAHGDSALVGTVQLYGVLALAIAMTAGSVGGDRGSDRRLILFQRPGSIFGHYARICLLGYACTTLVVTAVWLLGWIAGGPGVHVLVGSLAFATMVFAAGTLSTSVLRGGDAALVVFWTIAPVLATMVAQRLELSAAARAVIEAPFVPFDAVFGLQNALGSNDWATWRPRWTVQLIGFPFTCVLLASYRVRAMARNAME